ncbi:MAG: BrnT family toxin [Gammaproteobacteria bacterium]
MSRTLIRIAQQQEASDHSYDEHRYLIIGESRQRRLLLVSYTERGNIIRLISAREATRTERKVYEEG